MPLGSMQIYGDYVLWCFLLKTSKKKDFDED